MAFTTTAALPESAGTNITITASADDEEVDDGATADEDDDDVEDNREDDTVDDEDYDEVKENGDVDNEEDDETENVATASVVLDDGATADEEDDDVDDNREDDTEDDEDYDEVKENVDVDNEEDDETENVATASIVEDGATADEDDDYVEENEEEDTEDDVDDEEYENDDVDNEEDDVAENVATASATTKKQIKSSIATLAKASAHRHIPITKNQRKSSVANLYTNGLDPPKYNLLHKAQQPVAANAPGFREALESITIPPQMMFLYQTCLAKPKESFFISAIAHIQVISKACGLSTEEMIKMRGWVFLKKKSPKGAPYRYQSFADSVYETVVLGANNKNNPRKLVYRFDEVLTKMRTGYADLTCNFPSPIVVPSRKTSKKRGQEGQPLTKYLRGVAIGEKDLLDTLNYSKKIRNYFEKYHLGVGAVHIIFSDCVTLDYSLYFPLCDSLFKNCITETGYILTLHDALRVFYGAYSTSEDGVQSKKRWIENPHLFMVQVKHKFGKPGVLALERYEHAVACNFETLMNDSKKKTVGFFTAEDNAVLIRFRVQCFTNRNV
jgi:hypothetical protein